MPVPKGKEKFALWIFPDTKAKVKEMYRKDDCRSMSEFVEKAIRFYEKNGFYAIGTHTFIMGEDVQTDYIMRKDLQHNLCNMDSSKGV